MGLVMVRHTKPQVADGLCYGRLDLDVSEDFDKEARRISEDLRPPDQIVSSPLARCYKLAEFLGAQWSLPVETDTRLMEMDFGTWEGQHWDQIDRSELDAWSHDFLHACPHGGESVAQLTQRVRDALGAYLDRTESVLWVTHAGVIKAALANGPLAENYATQVTFGNWVGIP